MEGLDPRQFPWRADVAAAKLKAQVKAARYAEPVRHQVCVPVLDMLASPGDAALASQLICGEGFDVYDVSGGLAWGQSAADEYVGYVAADGLAMPDAELARGLVSVEGHAYPEPNIKTRPTAHFPAGATVEILETVGDFWKTLLGYLPTAHGAPPAPPNNPVEAAEALIGTPYLWGGRSSFGLDCSALVQVMMTAAHKACPRDSDMQAHLGVPVRKNSLKRGDLVFWRGHVGIMRSELELLHANAYHMRVASEPLSQAEARIAATDTGPITTCRRVL